MRRLAPLATALALIAGGPAAGASSPPSAPGPTAPELAQLGGFAVGRREVRLDLEGEERARVLSVLVWYPAVGGAATPYQVRLPAGGDADAPREASFPALSSEHAPPAGGPFPLVVLSHGFGNAPEWMSWLGENLASKGYVVAAPRHGDPPYSGPHSLVEPLRWRSADQAQTAVELPRRLARDGGAWAQLTDGARWGLIGYSMGGYGALQTAGAAPNPHGAPARLAAELGDRRPPVGKVRGLQALVLIAPWGGQSEFAAFAPEALRGVAAPTLVLAGERDRVSGYEDGVRRLFADLTCAERWLLTFERAGHNLGVNPAPREIADRRVGLEAFEDPVWRKDRMLGISQHLITALLDWRLRGREGGRAYLDGLSDDLWPGFPEGASAGLRAQAAPDACAP